MDKDISAFLDKNFETCLLNNVDKRLTLAKPEFPVFLNKTADDFLKIAPSSTDTIDLYKSHVCDLVCAMSLSNPYASKLMYVGDQGYRSAEDQRNRNHRAKKGFGIDDTLAAAAAVGNLEGTEFLLSEGATVLDWRSEGCIGFGSSLNIIAALGHVDILELLIVHAHREIAVYFTRLTKRSYQIRTASASEQFGWLDTQGAIQDAISCALLAHQTETSILLFGFPPKYLSWRIYVY
jgi:hypothetical protein